MSLLRSLLLPDLEAIRHIRLPPPLLPTPLLPTPLLPRGIALLARLQLKLTLLLA